MIRALRQAVATLDRYPPVSGTHWGDAIIDCREAAREAVKAHDDEVWARIMEREREEQTLPHPEDE